MRDLRRFLVIIVIILGVYSIYVFQSGLISFAQSPVEGFKNFFNRNPLVPEQIQETIENVRTIVIDEEDAVIDVVENSSDAVVSVVRSEVFFDPFDGPTRSEDSIGTGFIVDGENGTILTNRHVVSDSNVSYSVVVGRAQETYEVTEVYRDTINDFAILKIDTEGRELPSLKLGDSDKIKVGQTVIAIGNALGEFGNSVTKGVVSGLGRGIVARSGAFGESQAIENVIQTDAALNPGNSGGPLLNLSGEVIGINVAISAGAENIGFSIPINSIKSVLDTFEQEGRIIRPFLGVEYQQISSKVAEARSLPVGAFVQSVVEDSPASRGGIRQGDIILRIAGIRLDDSQNTLANVISRQPIGQDIEIVIDRNGREQTLTVRLVEFDGN